MSPPSDADFLYAGEFEGEAGRLLEAVGILSAGKPAETVLSEFQRGGYFVTHVLECPLESTQGGQPPLESLLMQRVSTVITRIRRSLKPKRVILTSELLAPLVARLSPSELGCPVVLDGDKPYSLDSTERARPLRQALGKATAGA